MAGARSNRKKLGQCFLVDESIADNIAVGSRVARAERVLEVGPGKGILTRAMLNHGMIVHAVELDGKLYAKLKTEFEGKEGITLERGNALRFDYGSIEAPYHVISNLPYSVSVPLIKKFVENLDKIKSMTLMTQAEVGKRLAAKAGDSHYGSLSIYMAYHCDIEVFLSIPPEVFRPIPKVDSVVIRLKPHAEPPVKVTDTEKFFRFTRTAFTHRRKTLKNNLVSLWGGQAELENSMRKFELEPSIRPERVSIEKFADLFNEWFPKYGERLN